jgi:O-antigen/teichoic acid export membrane protein
LALINLEKGGTKMAVILAAKIWAAFLAVVLVPVYVKLIGAESYGLVAFYSTLAGALNILDLGLSASISRQVAIYKTQAGKEKDLCDLVFSVEILNWIIAVAVGLLIMLLSQPIATYWVNAQQLDTASIQKSVMLMGAVFAFQFPSSVYEGTFTGLQKQITSAALNLIFTTLKAGGVLLVLYLVRADIVTYFIWQAVLTMLYTITLRWFVKKNIRVKDVAAVFSKPQLRIIWRFAAGMTGISLVTFFLAQIDKIVVSKYLLLEYVGYYSLAFLIAGGINAVLSPMQSVIYPKLTQLVATKNEEGLILLFHKACRWIAVIVFPLGFTLIFFAEEILFFWTGNAVLTKETAPILRVCTAGTVLNCLMWIPYYITLAKGNTRFGLYQNIIASIILVPLLFWWTQKYGALGASFVWLTVNAGVVLISIPVFNYIYFNAKQYWHWLTKDVLVPLLVAGSLALLAKYIQNKFLPGLNIFNFTLMLVTALIVYGLIISDTRNLIKKVFYR